MYKSKDIDDYLYKWFQHKRLKNFIITDDILRTKALDLVKEMKMNNFKASSGWLQSFKRRHQIQSFKLTGEADLIDTNVVDDFHTAVKNKLEQYDESNIFNCDELALFYKGLPERTLSFKKYQINTKMGSKVRVSILLCCSSQGEKLTPLIIGKYKSPRCLKNIDVKSLGLQYTNNSTAWMSISIFKEWLIEFNKKLLVENRKILLILDNSPVHPVAIGVSNIELLFLPPKTTGLTQPLDAGIIRSFKSTYILLLHENYYLLYLLNSGTEDCLIEN